MFLMVLAAEFQFPYVLGGMALHSLHPPGAAAVNVVADFTCSNPFVAHMFYFMKYGWVSSRELRDLLICGGI